MLDPKASRGLKYALAVATLLGNLAVTTQSANAAPKSRTQGQMVASERSSKPASSETQAKRIKYKKDTKVDFDDALIEGGVKNPFSSMVGSRDGENKAGFVKIRKEWHDQMIMSVNGLSQ
jgi:hypothetical protein